MTTLIQRQVAPFAYVPGTAHAALTGAGQFAVQGDIGISVDVTTVPGRAGSEYGNPLNLFDLGWLNVGTADGWVHRELITANPFLYLPPDMGVMTLVGYSLSPDVVATITELVREP
jgi:hypothetical protein